MQSSLGIRRYLVQPWSLAVTISLLFLVLGASTALAEHGNWRFQYLTNPDGVWVNEVVSLEEDDSGAIWVATWGEGLQRIHEATWETYSERTGFVGDWQYVVTRDSLGGIWVGTADGLCHIQGTLQTFLTTENTPALDSHEIRTIQNGADGDLLLGTANGIVYRCAQAHLSEAHPQDWEVLVPPELTGGTAIMDLLAIPGGSLWVSLKFGGIAEWDGSAWKVSDVPVHNSSFQFSHLVATSNSYWAGHAHAGHTMLQFGEGAWRPSLPAANGVGGFASAKDGTLYIGTTEGLQRLEGNTWHTVNLGEEIGNPNIRALLIDDEDTLWLGCEEGLIRGTRNSWETQESESDSEPLLHVISRREKGAPVFGLTTHLNLVELKGETQIPGLDLGQVLLDKPKSMTTPMGDRLWVIRAKGETVGISLRDSTVLERIPQPAALAPITSPYMKLVQGHGETLFLLSDAGLHQRRAGQWVSVPGPDSSRGWSRVLAVEEGPNNSYYIGGDDGIFQWDGGDQVVDLHKQYQIDFTDSVYAIRYQPSGDLWFGTQGAGIHVVSAGKHRQITRKDGLRSDMISGLYATGEDTIWVAYRRQGLGMFRNGQWFNYGYPQGLHNTAITNLSERENDDIWIVDAEGSRFTFHPDRIAPETRILAGPERIEAQDRAVFSFQGWDGWDHTPRGFLQYATRVTTADGSEVTPWSPLQDSTSWVAPSLPHGRYQFTVRASDEDGNVDPTPAIALFRVSPPLWLRPQFSIPLILAALFSLVMLISRYQHFRQLKLSQATITRRHWRDLEVGR